MVLSRSFISTSILLVEKPLPIAFSVDHIFMSLQSLSLNVERAFTLNFLSEVKETCSPAITDWSRGTFSTY